MRHKNSNRFLIIFLTSSILFLAFIIGGNIYISKLKETDIEEPIEANPIQIIQKILPTPSPKPISVILGGDVMLGRSVTIESLDKQNDPKYPFLNVSEYLNSADLVFVNLENPVTSNCPRIEHGYTFCSPPEMLEGLKYSGVDVVSIANNHTLNFGHDGFEQTKKYLRDYGIDSVGYGNLVINKVGDKRIGFLGFDFLTNKPKESDFNLVTESKEEVDYLIVGVHWGLEYEDEPRVYQKEWAKMLVESGADVISGHHPHWVQSDEMIGSVPVYYSLGNFVFDQMWSEETKKGLLIKLDIENDGISEFERFNTYIRNWAQPEIIN